MSGKVETKKPALTNPKVRAVFSSRTANVNLTPIEKDIMFVLADGEEHSIHDIVTAIGGNPENEDDRQNLFGHVARIRKKLEFLGDTILCSLRERTTHYVYVTLLKHYTIRNALIRRWQPPADALE